jgi:hypothetical protein
VHPHQNVGAVSLKGALQLGGIVARIEDEHGWEAAARQAVQQILNLPHRHVVGVLLRTRRDAPRLQGRDQRVALEGKPGDQSW